MNQGWPLLFLRVVIWELGFALSSIKVSPMDPDRRGLPLPMVLVLLAVLAAVGVAIGVLLTGQKAGPSPTLPRPARNTRWAAKPAHPSPPTP